MSTDRTPDAAGVELRFTALPEHVRTARLTAVAVARRCGVRESRLDEVRLAVGEVCALAVRRCEAQESPGPVDIRLAAVTEDGRRWLRIAVSDPVGESEATAGDVALSLVTGLADRVDTVSGRHGDRTVEGTRTLRLWWDLAG